MCGVRAGRVSLAHVSAGAPVPQQLLRELLAKQPLGRAAVTAPDFPLPVLDVRSARVYRCALDIE